MKMRKKVIFCLISTIIFFTGINLFGKCLGEPEGRILDFQGGQGVDSVVVENNFAYVTLNFIENKNGITLKGFGKVNISNPENFISYEKLKNDNNSYTVEKYIDDVSAIAEIYKYGKDFKFNEQLSNTPDSYVVTVDNGIMYGYSNSAFGDNISFVWKFDTNKKEFNYFTIQDCIVVNAMYKYNYLFVLTESVYDKNMYDVLAVPLNKILNTTQFNDYIAYTYFSSWTPDNQLPATNFYVYNENSEKELRLVIFQSYNLKNDNGTITGYKTDLDIVKLIDNGDSISSDNVQNISIPVSFDKILYLSCNYLIVSEFDKIKILKQDNDTYKIIGKVNVWDVSNGIVNNNILYVANMGANVDAIDISNPQNPYVIDNGTFWSATRDLFFYNNFLYVAHGWGGLGVYKVDTCIASNTSANYYTQCFKNEGNDNNSSNCNNTCFTIEDINAINSMWYLAGSGCNISDFSIFNNVSSVWSWDGNHWKVYSSKSQIAGVLKKFNIDILKFIPAKTGFWIQK